MTDEVSPGAGGFGVGSHVAGYRLDEEIGRGGMAVVYRALDSRLQRPVAMKILAPELARDEAFRQRFIRESRAAAAVDHPHIIPIYEAGRAGDVLFIAMRLVQAGDVQTLIDQHGPLPVSRVCHIVSQVASALDAAHARGLVHRDVKPANMLLDPAGGDQRGHVYLSDFGLSKRALGDTQLTSAGQFMGTLNYVPPEQIEGRPVDGRSDQYALACSVFTMLTGSPPFRQDESAAIMWAQLSTAPPPVTTRRGDLPAALNGVLARALAKTPDERYATCREFAAALREAGGLDVTAPGPPAPVRREPTVVARETAAAQPEPTAVPPAPAAAAREPATVPPAAAAPREPATAPPAPAAAPPPLAAPAADDGPATQFVRPSPAGAAPAGAVLQAPGGTLLEEHPPAAGTRSRQSRRSRATMLVAGVAVLGLAGGYFLLGGGGGKSSRAHHTAAALTPPACTTQVARADRVTHAPSQLVTVGGRPFDVVSAPGGYAFVSVGNGITVLRTSAAVPTILWTSQLVHAQGEAITRDRQYLLVTDGSGTDVFRVPDLEQGPATPIGSLTSPAGKHAVEVALTPDSRYAFVTFQGSAQVGVFSLRHALQSGFGPSDLVGVIPVGARPIGVAVSPDGRYAYVTSGVRGAPDSASGGVVNVIDVGKAETHPASSIVKTVAAGCRPSRVVPSPDGQDVWVTAGGSNSLLAFAAAKLISDPRHALVATVGVGSQPLGLAFADHGTRILVADSNRDQPHGGTSSLAVVDAARVLAGKPGLIGYLPAGTTPRQFALEPHGRVLVTNTDSAQLQIVNVSHLP